MKPHLFPIAAMVAAYLVWVVWCLFEERGKKLRGDPENGKGERKNNRADIVGASRFVLPRRLSQPHTAIENESEKGNENRDIFATATIPKHPRQIPPEELSEVFGNPPDGVENESLDIDYPLYESFPDERNEGPNFDNDESESEPIPGRTLAQGVTFEQMGEVYRRIAANNQNTTDEQKIETGRILSQMKGTDVFEAIVSGQLDGRDKVRELMDSYLASFQKRTSEGEGLSPQGEVPPDFDVRNFV